MHVDFMWILNRTDRRLWVYRSCARAELEQSNNKTDTVNEAREKKKTRADSFIFGLSHKAIVPRCTRTMLRIATTTTIKEESMGILCLLKPIAVGQKHASEKKHNLIEIAVCAAAKRKHRPIVVGWKKWRRENHRKVSGRSHKTIYKKNQSDWANDDCIHMACHTANVR